MAAAVSCVVSFPNFRVSWTMVVPSPWTVNTSVD